MRAMILSAGYGTRLWPLTEDRTKPAIPILGKPLVGYVAEYLARFGCNEILVNLHHRPESVRAALGDGSHFGVSLQYVEEPQILGTSGALDNARALLDDDTFVVINGKIITDIDLNAAIQTHKRAGSIATMILLPNIKRERFTIVETKDGFLQGFAGMPNVASSAGEGAPLMFTGIQIFEPGIFDFIPRGVFSHSTTDVFPQAIARGERIATHVATGAWYELSTLRRYLDISCALLAEKGKLFSAGLRCTIGERADLSQAILWDNVVVEHDAVVKRAVLGDEVTIRAGQIVKDAVVVKSSLVQGQVPPPKALKGAIRGDNFVVPLAE
jgi:NDP-sugar pyrophosphorylase family protein